MRQLGVAIHWPSQNLSISDAEIDSSPDVELELVVLHLRRIPTPMVKLLQRFERPLPSVYPKNKWCCLVQIRSQSTDASRLGRHETRLTSSPGSGSLILLNGAL